MSGGYGYGVKA